MNPQPKPVKKVKQRKPWRRSKSIRKRIPRRVLRETPQEKRYKAELHSWPCALSGCLTHACEGPIQQAHLRDHTGIGLKESVMDSIPLCRSGHEDYDQAKGFFSGWQLETRKQWMRNCIGICRLRFRAGQGRDAA